MSKELVSYNLPILGALGSLDAYVYAVNQIPMLSAEEERELAAKYQRENDLECVKRLILSHLRFVVHVARGYSGYGLQLADLIQEGNIGLMKAVKRFDPMQGVRLVSFAVHWIRAEMHEFILRNWRIVKVATTKAQRKLFFNLRKSKKRLGWMNAEEVRVVAKDLNVAESTVMEMEARLNGHDIAFDAPSASDEESYTAPETYLVDQQANPYESMESENEGGHRLEVLQRGLQQLEPRTREIIHKRWLKQDKATLQELADEYGVSAERIRQIETQAMKKIRALFVA